MNYHVTASHDVAGKFYLGISCGETESEAIENAKHWFMRVLKRERKTKEMRYQWNFTTEIYQKP